MQLTLKIDYWGKNYFFCLPHNLSGTNGPRKIAHSMVITVNGFTDCVGQLSFSTFVFALVCCNIKRFYRTIQILEFSLHKTASSPPMHQPNLSLFLASCLSSKYENHTLPVTTELYTVILLLWLSPRCKLAYPSICNFSEVYFFWEDNYSKTSFVIFYLKFHRSCTPYRIYNILCLFLNFLQKKNIGLVGRTGASSLFPLASPAAKTLHFTPCY